MTPIEMNEELVERLEAHWCPMPYGFETCSACEAIEEITKLREQVINLTAKPSQYLIDHHGQAIIA